MVEEVWRPVIQRLTMSSSLAMLKQEVYAAKRKAMCDAMLDRHMGIYFVEPPPKKDKVV